MACEWKYLLNPLLPWICPWIQSLHHAFMWINLVYFSLGFDDPSALLKHELAYCLGQMQVEFTCTCIFAYKMWKLWRALCLVQLGHSHFENFCPRFFSINNQNASSTFKQDGSELFGKQVLWQKQLTAIKTVLITPWQIFINFVCCTCVYRGRQRVSIMGRLTYICIWSKFYFFSFAGWICHSRID